MSKKIFISHSHKDSKLVGALRNIIEIVFKDTVKCYISSDNDRNEGVKGGSLWKKWIYENISTCDLFIIIFTPYSLNNSSWIYVELGYATKAEKKIVPVLHKIENSVSPISHIQSTRCDNEKNLEQLINTLSLALDAKHYYSMDNRNVLKYLKEIKKLPYPKPLTKNEIAFIAGGPAGLAIKRLSEWLNKY